MFYCSFLIFVIALHRTAFKNLTPYQAIRLSAHMSSLSHTSVSTISSDSPIYAAIDLGTVSCRLLIARYTSYNIEIIERCSTPILLGENLSQTGYLAEHAIARALTTLKKYAQKLKNYSLADVNVITTEVCRYAKNARYFIHLIKQETGLNLRVISSRKEAELAVESCFSLLGLSPHLTRPTSPTALASAAHFLPNRALLFDIGGGSTELSWVRLDHQANRHHLTGTTSLKIGIMSLAERFSPLSKGDAYHAIFNTTYAELLEFDRIHRIRRDIMRQNARMIGTSGTITMLASIALEQKRYKRSLVDGLCLGRATLMHALEQLKKMDSADMARHPCIKNRQSSFILAGCAIFDAIQSLWPVERIMIADRGLRDGMIVRMARKNRRTATHNQTMCPSHRRPVSHYPEKAFTSLL